MPIITIYEVYKKMLRDSGEDEARRAGLVLQSGQVIDLDVPLALEAARHSLPLADSLIYATALQHNATLWTQDEHIKELPQVRYFPKKPVGG